MIAILDNTTDSDALAGDIHSFLLANREGYNATSWSARRIEDSKYVIKIPTDARGLENDFDFSKYVVKYQTQDFEVEVKTPLITGKSVGDGKSYILAVQDNWMLGMYRNEDFIYLSDDNGDTWDYSIAMTDAMTIRMAWVFADGSILIATNTNKVYSSQDQLTSLNEITVEGIDGNDLVFHTPVNSEFPGSYFGMLIPASYIIDGVEVLLWGTYWTVQDAKGPAPVKMYYTVDNGVTVKVCYEFGPITREMDDGTSYGGPTGNPLGDPLNPIYCHHVHYVSYNTGDSTFYVQLGDYDDEVGFLKGTYDFDLDTWSFTHYNMSAKSDFFRAAGLLFDGDVATWVNDNIADGIYTCSVANLTSTDLSDHTSIFENVIDMSINDLNRRDLIGLLKQGNVLITARYYSEPAIIISIDNGANWIELPDITFFGAWPWKWYTVRRLLGITSDGYFILQQSPLQGLNPTSTFYIKIT